MVDLPGPFLVERLGLLLARRREVEHLLEWIPHPALLRCLPILVRHTDGRKVDALTLSHTTRDPRSPYAISGYSNLVTSSSLWLSGDRNQLRVAPLEAYGSEETSSIRWRTVTPGGLTQTMRS